MNEQRETRERHAYRRDEKGNVLLGTPWRTPLPGSSFGVGGILIRFKGSCLSPHMVDLYPPQTGYEWGIWGQPLGEERGLATWSPNPHRGHPGGIRLAHLNW